MIPALQTCTSNKFTTSFANALRWVHSTQQPPDQQNHHTLYNLDTSTTARIVDGHTWSIRYADGTEASGHTVVTDEVTVGYTTVHAQAVEVASLVYDSQGTQVDGVLGLGMDIGNRGKQP